MNVEVYILTGYLGSGKTTLLQKWLPHLKSQENNDTVVIMNEMGDTDVDGEQLQGMDFPVKKLMNGCICCSIRGELTDGMKEILPVLQPRRIIIETTGVADPIDVVDALTHPDLYSAIEIKGIISIVDASRYLQLISRFQASGTLIKTLRSQVRYADLLLVNKVDLISTDVLEKVKQKLREENVAAPLHTTIQSETDLDALLTIQQTAKLARENRTHSGPPVQKTLGRMLKQSLGLGSQPASLYSSINSFSYRFSGPVIEKRFVAFLLSLPNHVYRAKGYVYLADKGHAVSFQHTENQVMLHPLEGIDPEKVAVFIGEGFDQTKIIEDLKTCYA
ncbi:GTP-binding protein [Brevibacillus fluminis]|uniref:GTP-binding protein n=1 Tax=Brevibacillus fluminis TaxID=511487 RepID=A0A3M8CZH6_9BACL|nr:GTP-binding protein [Brevibacillus fluminis]RNB81123.1 GTP-binding protein [Brevibacillus fluminis]